MLNFKIENFDKLESALKQHKDLVVKEFSIAIAKAGYMVEAESKKVTPVDTGRLRSSIFTQMGFMQSIIQPNTEYAVFVHWGTRFMNARPFMQWGLDAAKSQIKDLFLEAENSVLKQVANKSK